MPLRPRATARWDSTSGLAQPPHEAFDRIIPTGKTLFLDQILVDALGTQPDPNPVLDLGAVDILRAREMGKHIYVDDKIKEYVLDLVLTTREQSLTNCV